MINVKAGPRRPPGHQARPGSRSPAPSLPHPWRPRGRRSSPGPSDSHPPGHTVPDPDPASAPAPPPPPPPAPRLPSRPPLREPPPGRGNAANASAPPRAAYAGPRAGGRRCSEGEGRAGAGRAAGFRTWGAARTAPAGTPPPGGAGAPPWLAPCGHSRGLQLSASREITLLRSQRSTVSGDSVGLLRSRNPEARPLALCRCPLLPLLLIVHLIRTWATGWQLEAPRPVF